MTRLIEKLSCNGFKAITNGVVEQFGIEIIFLTSFNASALTSGTIKGTSGSIRKAELSSIKIVLVSPIIEAAK